MLCAAASSLTYCSGHRNAAVNPDIALPRYSECAHTTSSITRARDSVDRLAIAAGQPLQSEDLKAWNAHFQADEAEELGDGAG